MIVYGTFGVLSEVSHGMIPTAYLIVLCAVLLTAVSYGKAAYIFPVAGSAYTNARKSIGSNVGFLVGWAVLLDYFILPMVIWLIGASYLGEAFPTIPTQVWLMGFILVTTIINFGAFLAFTFVNLSVISLVIRKHDAVHDTGMMTGLIIPAIGVVFNLYLLTSLDGKAITLGCIWLALGVAYLAYLTRGFSRQVPEMDLAEM